MKLINFFTLLIVMISSIIFASENINFKANFSSFYPGIYLSYKNSPHLYSASFSVGKNEFLPYFFYGQENGYFEGAVGSLIDYTFDEKLFYRSILPSSIYLKSTLKPVSLKLFLIENSQYLSLKLFDHYGLSGLIENSPSSNRNQLTTLSIFADYLLDFSSYKIDFFGTGHLLNSKKESTDEASGYGYTVGTDIKFNLGSFSHNILIKKIYFNQSKEKHILIENIEFFNPYFERLSLLRYTNADTLHYAYSIEKSIKNLGFKFDIENFSYLSFFSFISQYNFDEKIGFNLSLFKASTDPGLSAILNLKISGVFK